MPFVFTNGHGVSKLTDWFTDLGDLDEVDWGIVYERYWRDTLNDMNREWRKQAEFLIQEICPWSLIQKIVVIDEARKTGVEQILAGFSDDLKRVVTVKRDWYYW